MWLSKTIRESESAPQAEQGKITLSGNGVLEAEATQSSRNVKLCLPYGYTAGVPAGAEVMLLPAADCLLAVGTEAAGNLPAPGEVRIASLGGASVVLKNDGSVVINGCFTIDKEGNIIR